MLFATAGEPSFATMAAAPHFKHAFIAFFKLLCTERKSVMLLEADTNT
jgi:hypothetical protein